MQPFNGAQSHRSIDWPEFVSERKRQRTYVMKQPKIQSGSGGLQSFTETAKTKGKDPYGSFAYRNRQRAPDRDWSAVWRLRQGTDRLFGALALL